MAMAGHGKASNRAFQGLRRDQGHFGCGFAVSQNQSFALD
jgi:hypothetical protein